MEKVLALLGEHWKAVAVVVAVFVDISPIKINPVRWIFQMVGKLMFADTNKKFDLIEKRLEVLDKAVDGINATLAEEKAVNARIRILRFGDELLHGTKHTREHFEQTLIDIDTYERYCREHPDFKNHVTALTMEKIKESYRAEDFLA